jgi:aminoglycoside phosphotransferase (APT) family kinase protein
VAGGRTAPRFDPASSASAAAGLLAFRAKHPGWDDVRLAATANSLPGGWETYTYQVELRGRPARFPELNGPLVLRIYACAQGTPRAEHEFAVQRWLQAQGYPVPRPLHLETRCDFFGGPFLLMEQIPGETLFQRLTRLPWQLPVAASRMSRLHAQLHALSPCGFPGTAEGPVERGLAQLQSVIQECDLAGLAAGLDWLLVHRPAPRDSPCVLHLDFHPLNLVCSSQDHPVVVDWADADLGDPHADVATTLLLLDCVPPGVDPGWTRSLLPVGRLLLRLGYSSAYGWHRPLDEGCLAYYRAWAAFRRLVRYGRWLARGPASTGSKPSSLAQLTPGHLGTLERYFRRWSGVEVTCK